MRHAQPSGSGFGPRSLFRLETRVRASALYQLVGNGKLYVRLRHLDNNVTTVLY